MSIKQKLWLISYVAQNQINSVLIHIVNYFHIVCMWIVPYLELTLKIVKIPNQFKDINDNGVFKIPYRLH